MYSYKYVIPMKITSRVNASFSNSEICRLENSRIEHNDRFLVMMGTNTRNRKYISKIDTLVDGTLVFYLETEHPLNDIGRRGNALRFFSIIAADNGLDLFIKNHKLMRAA